MDNDYITIWELFQQYGIAKSKTNKAIKKKNLNAFMKTIIDNKGNEWKFLKWCIVKDKLLIDYIEKERIK